MPPAVIIHVAAGGLGIVSGFAALGFRKGQALHRVAGTVFFAAMLTMAGFAAVLAALGGQKLNVIAASFTFYLVATAWAVVRRGAGASGRFEMLALLAVLGVATAGLILGMAAATSATGLADGDPSSGQAATFYFLFAGLGALAAAADLWAIRRGGVSGADRVARHLWRMCLALAIAAGSFFLGQSDEIPAALRGAHLAIPPLAALAAMVFWLIRIRIPAGWWRPRAGRPLNPARP